MQNEIDAVPKQDIAPPPGRWAVRGVKAALVLTAAWWGLLLLVAFKLGAWIFEG
jgi:hypothetical protein